MATSVYIVNFAGHDYRAAEKYGALKSITPGFVDFSSLDRVKYQVGEAIMESTKDDWLLLSGTNLLNVLAVTLWLAMHGQVKILNFDKHTNRYRELVLSEQSNKNMLEFLTAERANAQGHS